MSKSRISFAAGSTARGLPRANTTQTQFGDKITGKVNQHIGGLVSVRGITNRRSYGVNQNMVFSMGRVGGIGRSFRSSQDGATSFEPYSWPPTEVTPTPPTPDLGLTIDFSQYADGPISDQNTSVLQVAGSATTQWSGGIYGSYFTNDSTNAEDIVSTTTCTSSGKAWRLQHVYGTGSTGTPYTPYTNYELSFANEAAFKANLFGKQQITTFYIKSEPSTASYGQFIVYNGAYQGNDRTGLNLYIVQEAGGLRLFSYSYVGGNFIATTIANNLPYNTCHKVVISAVYNADPNNDIFTYAINDGTPVNILSWMNVWRVANALTPVYGTRLIFYAPNASLSPVNSALLIDGIKIEINETPVPLTAPLSAPLLSLPPPSIHLTPPP